MLVDSPGGSLGRTRPGHLLTAALAFLILAVAGLVGSGTALGQTAGQMTFAGSDPSFGAPVVVNRPGGGTNTVVPSKFDLSVTTSGTVHAPEAGFCVDIETGMAPGEFSVIVESPADTAALTSADYQAIAWLLARTPALMDAAADPAFEAGALQMAIWVLAGQADATDPVAGNAALEARTLALVAEASGKSLTTLSITPSPSSAEVGSTVALSLTGTPGTTADLSITSGTGTLGASSVTFDGSGSASTTLTSGTDGSVAVSATTAAGELRRAVKDPQAEVPAQDVVYLIPASAATSVGFVTTPPPVDPPVDPPVNPPVDPPVDPPTTPQDTPQTPASTPAAPPAPAESGGVTRPAQNVCLRPNLRVKVTGPKRPRAGTRTRYKVKITNRSPNVATRVSIRIAVPRGYSIVRRPRNSRLNNGDVVISRNAIRARGMYMTTIVLRADRTARGRSAVRVSASARCSRTKRGALRIATRPVFQRVSPAVTG